MDLIGEIIYMLCAFTSLACAMLLARGYYRNRSRILLWSVLGFMLLAVNNALLFLDKVIFLSIDLTLLRDSSAVLALAVLVAGLIWDGD